MKKTLKPVLSTKGGAVISDYALHLSHPSFTRAFTLIEAVVVLAIVAVLAALLLRALGRAKSAASSTPCFNNLKQLQLAWISYVHDNNDSIPPNIIRRVQFDLVNGEGSWVLGNALLDVTTSNIEAGVLFQYVPSASVYHCPADKSTVLGDRSLRRARSYSSQQWLNCDAITGNKIDDNNDSLFNLRKASRIVDPPPGQAWVFIDEHELSIDDGCFKIANPSYAPSSNRNHTAWLDFPADRHDNGVNLSFADGHVEHHPWRFHRRIESYVRDSAYVANTTDSDDLAWLRRGLPRTP